ncbi:MAG TPA: O-antigen ligase family protein [Phycisphaerae bacterium]|nr:O-antigen ligase family protein [Phycisphaerae bacterium]
MTSTASPLLAGLSGRQVPGSFTAHVLRRAVLAVGAAGLLVLPQFSTQASFIGVPDTPGPLTVLLLGLVFWLMPILLVLSWVAESRLVIPSPWLAVPVGLFALGAAVSTAVAADKAAAIVRAAQLTGLWVGFFALVQAIRSDADRRFLLAAVLAAAVVPAALAVYQATVSLPATWDYFQAHREAVLAHLGIEPGSWKEQMYIGRFFGGVQATLGHPNVLAALLVLAILAGAGLAREKWAEVATRGARGLAVVVALVVALGLVAVVLTQSRAALAALAVGFWWLAVAWGIRRRWLRIALYLVPFLAAAGLVAAAVGAASPLAAGTLKTLAYRLDYWRATREVLRSHGLAGVGLENFGFHYLQHKVPSAVEEIRDPHNLFLSVWSQMGVAGLAAVVVLAAMAVKAWMRKAEEPLGADAAPAPSGGRSLVAMLLPVCAVAAPVVIASFAMGWPIGILAIILMAIVLGLASADSPARMNVSDRPLRAARTACIVALLAFALMEQIGTAVLEPPTAWLMLVLVGLSLGPPRASAESPPWRGRHLAMPIKFLLMVAVMGFVFAYARWLVVPVGREQAMFASLQSTADVFEQDELLRRAAEANPLTAEPDLIRGEVWVNEARKGGAGAGTALCLDRAVGAFRDALHRQPRLRRAWIYLAEAYLLPEGALDDPAALTEAFRAIDEAARLYPTDLPTQLRRADLLDRLADDARAADAYRRVLQLDRLMPDPRRRLDAERRRTVEDRLRTLEELLASPAPAP